MKLVYIHQYFETPGQFAGIRSYQNARALIEAGHQVTMISGAAHYHSDEGSSAKRRKLIEEQEIDGIRVLWISTLFSYHQSFVSRLLSFISFMVLASFAGLRSKADVVYATSPPLTVIIPAFVISRLKRARLVFEIRDLWPESAVETGILKSRFLIKCAEWLESFSYKVSHTLVAVSGGIEDSLIARGISPTKIRMVPHGADLEYLHRVEKTGNPFRREHNLEGKFVAVYAGSFGWANSLETVLEAARLLHDEPDVRIVLLGGGAEKAELQKRAAELQLTNVIFAAPISKKEISSVVGAADLGLMVLRDVPVFSTVLPNKLLDYLGCAIPVLINFAGYASDIVKQAEAGLLVSPGSSVALNEGIRSVLSLSEEERTTMGDAGRRYVEKNFSRQLTAQQFVDVVLEETE